MQNKIKIFAICGSTKQNSSNYNLTKAIEEEFKSIVNFTIFNDLVSIPHFSVDEIPEPVLAFTKQIDESDGVLICTPEYAHGVPGSLKNAIDWTVGSNQFSNKPTCLITASTDGQFGHKALLETLRVLEAKHIDELQMIISFIQNKVNKEGKITDNVLKAQLILLIQKMIDRCTEVNQQ
jgi:chromate reductase, NAD(P)H dehydrogenase (quinone)